MVVTMLEMRLVTEFDRNAPGWSAWRDGAIRGPRDDFSFLRHGEEVCRARIYPEYPLHARYNGLPPGLVVNLDLIVVRDQLRGQGIGLEAVRLLMRQYLGQQMIAFASAEGFWAKTDWVKVPRSEDDVRAWPLYAWGL